jgi:hypothetical protein
MPEAQASTRTVMENPSAALAQSLRTGPIRSILDRIVRSAAEATGIPCMVLGLRYEGFYEFISTHGIPLTHYRDRVPAAIFQPELFAREIEVADLQMESHFGVLSVVPIAKSWRYGGNVPVRLHVPLPDGGVLALSCADVILRKTGGKELAVLRSYAEMIGDLIWLSSQIERESAIVDPRIMIQAVLQAGLQRIGIPVCIVDADCRIMALSKSFAAVVTELGSAPLVNREVLAGQWFTPALQNAVKDSIASDSPRKWLPVTQNDWNRQLLNVFPFSFFEHGKFAVLAFHDGAEAVAAAAAMAEQQGVFAVRDALQYALEPADAGSDGVGPVSRFLVDTLVKAQRLYTCSQTSYIGLRKWRSAIKPHQIAALKALKSDPSDAFVSAVAEEMVESVRAVYGDASNCVVVPVPCGSSGPDCFSCRLAGAVASRLNIAKVEAFAPIDVARGSSHPRRNIKRPNMKLLRTVDQPVILIDDVSTSGSHINEAASLLRTTAPQVWPIVWISD